MRKFRIIAAAVLLLIFTGNAVALLGPFASFVVRMGGTPAFSEFLLMSGTAVGSAIAFVTIAPPSVSTPSLAVQLAPDAPLPTPPGWTASTGATGTAGKPTPPSTASTQQQWYYSPTATYYTQFTAICDKWRLDQNFNKGDSPADASPTCYACVNPVTNCWATDNGKRTANFNPQNICPTGYTNNSGTCTLTNAAVVQKPADGTCNIVRTGNSYAYDSLDAADCANPGSQISISGGTVSGTSTGGGTFSVVTGADGKTQVKQQSPSSTAFVTDTTTVNLSAPSSGSGGSGLTQTTVTGATSGQQVGTGDLTGSDGVNNETGEPCGAPGQPICNVKVDETGTPTDSSLSTEKTAFDEKTAERVTALQGVGTVSNLGLGLSITWPTAGCSDLTFAMPASKGNLVVPWCSRQADIKNAGAWFVGILTAFGLFSIGVGALRKG